MSVSYEEAADLIWPESDQPSDFHRWGRVAGLNADGSAQVAVNASSVTAQCSKLCSVATGDRVLVLVMATGDNVIIGKGM